MAHFLAMGRFVEAPQGFALFDTQFAFTDETADNPRAVLGNNGAPLDEPKRSRRPFRIVPDSYNDGKERILRKCREVVCQKGLEAPDIVRGGYSSWRGKYHQYLLNEDDHYFSLTSALLLAHACKVTVEIKV